MNSLKRSLLLLCMLSTLFLFAQKNPIKWGKIPAEDLTMTVYEQDTSAGAVVLCDYGQIDFNVSYKGLIYELRRHKRIKILNRSGFDEADIEIPYHSSQELTKLKAHIYSPDGSVTEIKKSEMFTERHNKEWSIKKIAIPNVQEGAVIEYLYEMESDDLYSLRSWYFQDFIPTRSSEFRFNVLEWLSYSTVQTGSHKLKINENTRDNTEIAGHRISVFKSRWVAEHVPAIKMETHIANANDYRSRMQFQLKSSQLPGAYVQKAFSDWNEIADILIRHDKFGSQYLKKGSYKKLLNAAAPALEAATSQLEKAIAAYNFVNNEIKWNGEHYILADESLVKAFEKKAANSGEMNLMILALLRSQGIQSYPVMVSTRSNGKPNPYYPLVRQFDHTLVQAEIDGKKYWIDAGKKVRPFGTVAAESLNFQGFKIDEKNKNHEWIDLIPPKTKDVMLVNAKLDEDGEMTAEITCSHTGYSAIKERSACAGKDGKEHWQNRLDNNYPEVNIESISLENQVAPHKPLKNKMALNLPDAAMANGDMLYISPTIYSQFAENPFKVEERTLPIEFPYPQTEQVITNLTLPEGYAVEGLPENVKLSLPEGAGSFSYRVSEVNGKVQVISKLEVKKTFFLPEEYAALRNFFSMVEEKQGEQVVLKKRT